MIQFLKSDIAKHILGTWYKSFELEYSWWVYPTKLDTKIVYWPAFPMKDDLLHKSQRSLFSWQCTVANTKILWWTSLKVFRPRLLANVLIHITTCDYSCDYSCTCDYLRLLLTTFDFFWLLLTSFDFFWQLLTTFQLLTMTKIISIHVWTWSK